MQNGCRSHEIRWPKGLPEPQVESLLRTAMNLGIQRPNFIAKPRTSGNANHATKYMEIKSIHPRVQAYNCGYGVSEEKMLVLSLFALSRGHPFCIQLRHSTGDGIGVIATLGSLSLALETSWEM